VTATRAAYQADLSIAQAERFGDRRFDRRIGFAVDCSGSHPHAQGVVYNFEPADAGIRVGFNRESQQVRFNLAGTAVRAPDVYRLKERWPADLATKLCYRAPGWGWGRLRPNESMLHAIPISILTRPGIDSGCLSAEISWVGPNGGLAKVVESVPIENGVAVYNGPQPERGLQFALRIFSWLSELVFRSGPLHKLPGPPSPVSIINGAISLVFDWIRLQPFRIQFRRSAGRGEFWLRSSQVDPNPKLQPLAVFVGAWSTESTHPLLPGRTFHGRTTFEWLESGAFLLARLHTDGPEIPDGIAIFGTDDAESNAGSMLYFDVRGISREYHWSISGTTLTWSRNTPELSQRMQLNIAPDGDSIVSTGAMSREGGAWEPDLQATYTRASPTA
jgi:hypothetical protein